LHTHLGNIAEFIFSEGSHVRPFLTAGHLTFVSVHAKLFGPVRYYALDVLLVGISIDFISLHDGYTILNFIFSMLIDCFML